MSIDTIIPSKIKVGSSFFQAIFVACSDPLVTEVIESGAGIGDGATLAILSALSKKKQGNQLYIGIELSTIKFEALSSVLAAYSFASAINGNAAPVADYLTASQIKSFYWTYDSDFRKESLKNSIARMNEELDYIQNRNVFLTDSAMSDAVTTLSADLVLLNGSDFSSESEYATAYGDLPLYFALYDTNGIKNKLNAAELLANDYVTYSSGIDDGVSWSVLKYQP